MDSADAVLRVCGYLFEYPGFPDVVGYYEDYGSGDDWEFVEDEVLRVDLYE